MLQQTQVARVVPRYLEWVERWPSVEALAGASLADAIRAWLDAGADTVDLVLPLGIPEEQLQEMLTAAAPAAAPATT